MLDYVPSLDEKKLKSIDEKQQAMRVVYIQIACTAVVALIAAIFYSKAHSVSAIYGALTVVVPTMLLVWVLFSKKVQTAQQQLKTFYKAEALKWLASIGLFICFMVLFPIKPLAYFISFAVGLLSYWAALWTCPTRLSPNTMLQSVENLARPIEDMD